MDKQREQFEAWAKGHYMIDKDDAGEYWNGFTQDAWASWQAAVGAQEVSARVPFAWHYHDHNPLLAEPANAFTLDPNTAAAMGGRPLYLHPPAQAVDLGKFRPFVEAQRAEYISHGLTEEDYCVAECDELLDLIDSQA